tara:strand:- start:3967 stop:4266 length:300 start_codon:yes stop_codon:yes gene_type:complete
MPTTNAGWPARLRTALRRLRQGRIDAVHVSYSAGGAVADWEGDVAVLEMDGPIYNAMHSGRRSGRLPNVDEVLHFVREEAKRIGKVSHLPTWSVLIQEE